MPRTGKRVFRPANVPAASGHRRTRRDHALEIAEDYVELIEKLIHEQGEARAVDMASELGVTHVTVTKTVARLIAEGWITSEPYRSIFLTPKGRRLATHARKRHQLVVAFLQAIGVPTTVAEADAEGIEHHVSPKTMRAMKNFLLNSRSSKKRKTKARRSAKAVK